MTPWTSDQLDRIGTADELEIAALRGAARRELVPFPALPPPSNGRSQINSTDFGPQTDLERVAQDSLAAAAVSGGPLALAWVAFKVGALSYGGGFVIIPLMQHDAVDTCHWMSDGQFLNAVALGQITPGPVVQTVAVVGYAAAGIGGGLLAALVAFAPSFSFILIGAERFDRLRANRGVLAFLDGRIQPGQVFDRTVDLDGYRAMADRESISVRLKP